MTDSALIRRHAREFAILTRTEPADVLMPLNQGPHQYRQSVACRQAAMRVGLGIGLTVSAVAREFGLHRDSVRAADGRYRSDGEWRIRRRLL